jgi:hypothetical protein
VLNSANAVVFQGWWDDLPLTGGTAVPVSLTWPTPSGLPSGTYTVVVKSFATGGLTTLYGQNTNAATFTIQ